MGLKSSRTGDSGLEVLGGFGIRDTEGRKWIEEEGDLLTFTDRAI
jgi:hypothetical protein